MHDEDYVVVQQWSDVLGQWYDVDEATSEENAKEMIRQMIAADVNKSCTFSFYHVRRVVFGLERV